MQGCGLYTPLNSFLPFSMKRFVSFVAATSLAFALIPAGFARNAGTLPGMMEKYKTRTASAPKPVNKGMVQKDAMMNKVMMIIKNRMSVRQTARSIRDMKHQSDRKIIKRVAPPMMYFVPSSSAVSSAMTSSETSTATSGTTSSAASSATSSN